MAKHPIVILALLAAVGAVFWLMGGAALFTSGDGASDDTGSEADATRLAREAEEAAGAARAEGGDSRGPVLFGRARAARVGRGTVTGRVADFRSGQPLEAASVVLSGTGYAEEAVAFQGMTDAQGRFAFDAVPAGDRYGLHVVGGAGLNCTLSSISVDADAVRDLGTIWLGERGTLKGFVVDADGHPVADAQVQIHRGGGSILEMLSDFTKLIEEMDKDTVPLVTVETDRAGAFEAPSVDPGPLTLVVRAPSYLQKMLSIVMTSEGAAGGELKIQLAGSTPLAGVVVDHQGRGIGGARVAFIDKGDMNAAVFGRLFTQTDAGGRFRVESPPAQGAFSAMVVAAGYPTLMTEARGDGEDLRFVLRGGVDVVVRLLEKGTQRPIEMGRLMATFGSADVSDGKTMSFANATTDHRGEARFVAPEGQLMMLLLNHPERGPGMFSPMMGSMGTSGTLVGPQDATIKAPSTTLVFHLRRGLTISGRVTDAAGAPIAGARCRALAGIGMGRAATTDAEGRYTLTGQSAPVRLVIVTASGYVQDKPEKGLSLMGAKPGEEVTLDVTMLRAASISGRILGPDAEPLAGVRVKFNGAGALGMLAASTGVGGEGITNRSGQYMLDGVSPGKGGKVLARLAGHLDAQSPTFEVKAGAANQVPDLQLKLGSHILLRVLDSNGRVASTARVEVDVQARETIRWDAMSGFRSFADLTTTAAGTAQVRDLPDGVVTLTASKDGFASGRVVLTVAHGKGQAEHELVVRLREPFTLRGRVTNREGQPLAKVIVHTAAQDADEDPGAAWVPYVTATSDKEGRFEIPDVPDEPLQLVATGKGFRKVTQNVAGARQPIELRMERIDPDSTRRLAVIRKELAEIYQRFASIKDDAERTALAQRMMALRKEEAELAGAETSAETDGN